MSWLLQQGWFCNIRGVVILSRDLSGVRPPFYRDNWSAHALECLCASLLRSHCAVKAKMILFQFVMFHIFYPYLFLILLPTQYFYLFRNVPWNTENIKDIAYPFPPSCVRKELQLPWAYAIRKFQSQTCSEHGCIIRVQSLCWSRISLARHTISCLLANMHRSEIRFIEWHLFHRAPVCFHQHGDCFRDCSGVCGLLL